MRRGDSPGCRWGLCPGSLEWRDGWERGGDLGAGAVAEEAEAAADARLGGLDEGGAGGACGGRRAGGGGRSRGAAQMRADEAPPRLVPGAVRGLSRHAGPGRRGHSPIYGRPSGDRLGKRECAGCARAAGRGDRPGHLRGGDDGGAGGPLAQAPPFPRRLIEGGREMAHRGWKRDGFTPEKKARALEALEKYGNVSDACRVAGISDTTFYRHLNRDPDFAK